MDPANESLPAHEIPQPPETSCDICGKPIEYQRKPNSEADADAVRRFLPNFKAFWWAHYSRIEHDECRAEFELRLREETRKRHIEGIQARRVADVTEWYERDSLPRDARTKTFESFEIDADNQKAVRRLKAWRTGDDFGFIISGPAGTGKSHLGFALLNRTIGDYLSAPIDTGDDSLESGRMEARPTLPAYFSISEMLAEMRSKQGTSEIDWRIEKPAPLLLDDLGTENITDWSRDILFRIFDYRLNHRYPTFVTTNLSLNELKERLHERVTSRILGLCIPVLLKGKDRRLDILSDKVKLLSARISET